MTIADLTEDQAKEILDMIAKKINQNLAADICMAGTVCFNYLDPRADAPIFEHCAIIVMDSKPKMAYDCLPSSHTFKAALEQILQHEQIGWQHGFIRCPSLEELLIQLDIA